MPSPTRQQVHIDRALTDMSVAFIQKAENFIADKVFPIVKVQKQSDRYFVYLKEDWFRDEAEERAPATESAGGGYEIDNTPTYFCRKYAYHKDVTEEDRTNSDAPLDADQDAMEFVNQKVLLRREVQWVTQFFTPAGAPGARTSAWGAALLTGTRSGVAVGPVGPQFLQWSVVGSTPIEDISAGKLAIASQTGFKPNTLALGANVYEALKNHDDILGRIVFTQRGFVTSDILAALFEVDNVVVSWAVLNVSPKRVAENTNFLAGNHALLCYRPPRPALKTASAGYTFAWTGLRGANAYGGRVLRIPVPLKGIDTERIEGELAFDLRVIAADLGIFYADAV